MSRSSEFTARNEGYRQFPYKCTAGKTTIAYGLNLDDVGISEEEGMVLLNMRLAKVERDLSSAIPWFDGLNEARKAALIDMAYQMGVEGLLSFKRSLILMSNEAYFRAGVEVLDSKWAEQTPRRANKVCNMIQNGEFQ